MLKYWYPCNQIRLQANGKIPLLTLQIRNWHLTCAWPVYLSTKCSFNNFSREENSTKLLRFVSNPQIPCGAYPSWTHYSDHIEWVCLFGGNMGCLFGSKRPCYKVFKEPHALNTYFRPEAVKHLEGNITLLNIPWDTFKDSQPTEDNGRSA